MKAIFTSAFEEDFGEIVAYLAAEVTPELSVRFENAVVAAFEQIVTHPEIGRSRRDLAHPEVRSLGIKSFENYLVFYQVRKNDVLFVRLLHGARDLPGLI